MALKIFKVGIFKINEIYLACTIKTSMAEIIAVWQRPKGLATAIAIHIYSNLIFASKTAG
jgi:hypothetical protein